MGDYERHYHYLADIRGRQLKFNTGKFCSCCGAKEEKPREYYIQDGASGLVTLVLCENCKEFLTNVGVGFKKKENTLVAEVNFSLRGEQVIDTAIELRVG